MKIQIHTSEKAKYSGQFDNWTETKIGDYILDEDFILCHKSHKLIKEFKTGITTCVFNEEISENMFNSIDYASALELDVIEDRTHIARKDNLPEYVYEMILPKGTKIQEYKSNEYRFMMNSDIKIYLIGEMGTIRVKSEKLFPYESRVYGGKTINVFTKKY